MILYLHGFRSAPASFKANLLARRMAELGLADQWLCPQLPASPGEAIDLCLELVAPHDKDDLTLIGSSLGGYYAIWLAEQLGCKAALLSPAVHAYRALASHVGKHATYHSAEPFEFKPEYVQELEDIRASGITRPERYLLLAATGDEVLDWREMRDYLAGAQQLIIQGSDHGISDFADWMPQVLAFAGIPTDQSTSPRLSPTR